MPAAASSGEARGELHLREAMHAEGGAVRRGETAHEVVDRLARRADEEQLRRRRMGTYEVRRLLEPPRGVTRLDDADRRGAVHLRRE
jgi:hypothetical protein